ncbi:MAG: STAS domain-containing protein [Dermatophilaceae bacterium]
MIATTTTTHSAPRVDVRTQGDGTLVRVTGRIDVHTTADLRPRLHDVIDTASGPLLLDLGDALIADGTGLGLLLECHRRGTRRGRVMRLIAADERCRRLLRRLAMRRHTAPVW